MIEQQTSLYLYFLRKVVGPITYMFRLIQQCKILWYFDCVKQIQSMHYSAFRVSIILMVHMLSTDMETAVTPGWAWLLENLPAHAHVPLYSNAYNKRLGIWALNIWANQSGHSASPSLT